MSNKSYWVAPLVQSEYEFVISVHPYFLAFIITILLAIKYCRKKNEQKKIEKEQQQLIFEMKNKKTENSDYFDAEEGDNEYHEL